VWLLFLFVAGVYERVFVLFFFLQHAKDYLRKKVGIVCLVNFVQDIIE